MLVVSCPNCGAPSPISLFSPEVKSCTSCGQTTGLSPDVAQRIKQSAAALSAVDVRERQLSAGQRSALTSGCLTIIVYMVVACTIILPSLIWAALGVSIMVDRGFDVPFFAFFVLPGLVMILLAALGLTWMSRTRKKLRLACAASPPLAQGAPARCRVCGADLVAGSEAVVRCSYCESDNLVTSSIVSQVVREQMDALQDFEQQVAQQGKAFRRTAVRAFVSLILSIVVAPIVAGFVFVVAIVVGMAFQGPADESIAYAVLETPAGPCLAKVEEGTSSGYSLDLGYSPAQGVSRYRNVSTLEEMETLRASEIVGRIVNVREADHGPVVATGVVTRVYSNATGYWNYAEVDGYGRYIEGLCFVEGSQTVPVPAEVTVSPPGAAPK